MSTNVKVFSIGNQKGGVGKTTTTINLGAALVKQGKRVLLVDLDPQANLTMAMGYPQPDELEVTIAGMMKQEIAKRSGFAVPDGKTEDIILTSGGIDFIPASIELAGVENLLINTMSRENILKSLLEPYKNDYDYIIIDCLPSLNILTVNALNASDEVIIPVQAQYLSLKGLELLLQTIASVRTNLNPKLTIAGVLVTMLDRRANFQKEVVEALNSNYGQYIRIFESVIPTSVKVSETQSRGESIIGIKRNKVAEGYENFAKELVSDGQ